MNNYLIYIKAETPLSKAFLRELDSKIALSKGSWYALYWEHKEKFDLDNAVQIRSLEDGLDYKNRTLSKFIIENSKDSNILVFFSESNIPRNILLSRFREKGKGVYTYTYINESDNNPIHEEIANIVNSMEGGGNVAGKYSKEAVHTPIIYINSRGLPFFRNMVTANEHIDVKSSQQKVSLVGDSVVIGNIHASLLVSYNLKSTYSDESIIESPPKIDSCFPSYTKSDKKGNKEINTNAEKDIKRLEDISTQTLNTLDEFLSVGWNKGELEVTIDDLVDVQLEDLEELVILHPKAVAELLVTGSITEYYSDEEGRYSYDIEDIPVMEVCISCMQTVCAEDLSDYYFEGSPVCTVCEGYLSYNKVKKSLKAN